MTQPDPGAFAWKPPVHEGPQKTVLVAEDERATQNLCRVGLRGLAGFRILVASNGAEALDILRTETVDVLVSDLNMPVMDGFQLIATVGERYPHIPILVMTSLREEEHRNMPLTLGALKIFPKPVRLSALMEEIRAAAQREPDGLVRGIGLNSLLQLMEWERRNATLTVHGPEGTGQIYVKDGQVVHAASRDLESLEAAYAILNWEKVSVEFVSTCRVERTIDLPTTELLLNAALIRDTGPFPPPEEPLDPWSRDAQL